jgi:hypothetical protein
MNRMAENPTLLDKLGSVTKTAEISRKQKHHKYALFARAGYRSYARQAYSVLAVPELCGENEV